MITFKKPWNAPDSLEAGFRCSPSGMNYNDDHGRIVAVRDHSGDTACMECAVKLRLIIKPRSHRNTPRKTARERAVYVINRGAMAEDIEKQIQLAVKAYAKRKANRK